MSFHQVFSFSGVVIFAFLSLSMIGLFFYCRKKNDRKWAMPSLLLAAAYAIFAVQHYYRTLSLPHQESARESGLGWAGVACLFAVNLVLWRSWAKKKREQNASTR